jgi:hypothetical protein
VGNCVALKTNNNNNKESLMAFAIARVQKLKSSKKMAKADAHNSRSVDVTNADTSGKHYRIVDNSKGQSLDDHVAELMTGAKTKKDTVGAIEIMLTASPEYFRPEAPELWGVYDKERTKAWLDKTVDFIKQEYGEGVIHALDLHLDESTPHVHITLIPVYEKTKQRRRTKEQIRNGAEGEKYTERTFDAQRWAGRPALVALQDNYAAAMQSLGLARGLKKSKAKHEAIARTYTRMMDSGLEIQEPKFGFIKPEKGESIKGIVLKNLRQNLGSIRDLAVINSRLAEQWRLEAQRSKAAAAGYTGLPSRTEYKDQLRQLKSAESGIKEVQARADSLERSSAALERDFDHAVADAVRERMPDAIAAVWKDKHQRTDALRMSREGRTP